MTPGTLAALLYGVLNIAGGMLGYVKSKSKISLIMGCSLGTLLVLFAIATLMGYNGIPVSTVLTGLLVVVFGIRWVKTKKIMPAGLMVLLGIASFVVMIFAK